MNAGVCEALKEAGKFRDSRIWDELFSVNGQADNLRQELIDCAKTARKSFWDCVPILAGHVRCKTNQDISFYLEFSSNNKSSPSVVTNKRLADELGLPHDDKPYLSSDVVLTHLIRKYEIPNEILQLPEKNNELLRAGAPALPDIFLPIEKDGRPGIMIVYTYPIYWTPSPHPRESRKNSTHTETLLGTLYVFYQPNWVVDKIQLFPTLAEMKKLIGYARNDHSLEKQCFVDYLIEKHINTYLLLSPSLDSVSSMPQNELPETPAEKLLSTLGQLREYLDSCSSKDQTALSQAAGMLQEIQQQLAQKLGGVSEKEQTARQHEEQEKAWAEKTCPTDDQTFAFLEQVKDMTLQDIDETITHLSEDPSPEHRQELLFVIDKILTMLRVRTQKEMHREFDIKESNGLIGFQVVKPSYISKKTQEETIYPPYVLAKCNKRTVTHKGKLGQTTTGSKTAIDPERFRRIQAACEETSFISL